jgi:hypothetical protein
MTTHQTKIITRRRSRGFGPGYMSSFECSCGFKSRLYDYKDWAQKRAKEHAAEHQPIKTFASYFTAGRKAGIASKRNDPSVNVSWHQWMTKAIYSEATEKDKAAAYEEYKRGFQDGRSAAVS